ncbi:MAG: N-acetylneuraminate synthase family protein [Candidatus Peribacteraceae bacterium]|nr:N-acetylneuraminate synthase family protein [Candidatus Peribacteraceae bacterium]
MKKIKIGDRWIGEDEKTFIIAEAGANFRISEDPEINYHHALKLIDIAIEAKADAVKFQLYRADSLYVENAGYADYIGKRKSIYQIINEMEIPYDWLPKLKKYCDEKEIIFLCTPFDEKSADQLENIGILAYKIASYTITHLPLIRHIAKFDKPIILSTGASNIDDIQQAIDTIKGIGNNQISLMQCTAKYPAPLSTVNLRVIPELEKIFQVPVGLSDHTREPLIAPLGAVTLGANIIEKHYTTDNNLPGPDHGFAILADELKLLVKSIRDLELCLGSSNKEIQNEEEELHQFCRRRIYTLKDIKEGETLSDSNIAILRSGKQEIGLEPIHLEQVLGKKAKHLIKKNDPVLWKDLE